MKHFTPCASSDIFVFASPDLTNITDDSAERDGSSWRMCILICFHRFLYKLFSVLRIILDLSLSIHSEEGGGGEISATPHHKPKNKHDGIFSLLSFSILKTLFFLASTVRGMGVGGGGGAKSINRKKQISEKERS